MSIALSDLETFILHCQDLFLLSSTGKVISD